VADGSQIFAAAPAGRPGRAQQYVPAPGGGTVPAIAVRHRRGRQFAERRGKSGLPGHRLRHPAAPVDPGARRCAGARPGRGDPRLPATRGRGKSARPRRPGGGGGGRAATDRGRRRMRHPPPRRRPRPPAAGVHLAGEYEMGDTAYWRDARDSGPYRWSGRALTARSSACGNSPRCGTSMRPGRVTCCRLATRRPHAPTSRMSWPPERRSPRYTPVGETQPNILAEQHTSSIAEARSLKPTPGHAHTSVIDMSVNSTDEVFGTRRGPGDESFRRRHATHGSVKAHC
jgi:hypothetical protein